MQDCSVYTSQHLVFWLYRGFVKVPEHQGIRGYIDLVDLAESHNIETLRNHIMDEIRFFC